MRSSLRSTTLRPVVTNVGSGKAIVSRKAELSPDLKEASNTALTLMYDDSGKEIPLVRGEIFMQKRSDRDRRHVQVAVPSGDSSR